jgi:beta-lactamase regulating signal transducer with metallopeptidase domain
VVLAAVVLMRLFKRTTAAERYAVWLAVLAVVALAPAMEALLSWAGPAAPPMEMIEVRAAAVETASLRSSSAPQRWEALAVSARPFLLLWILVSLALVVRLWRRCSLAARLKRNALPPDAELTAALAQWESQLAWGRVGSTRITKGLRSPAAVGWLEPAVLLPEDSQASLDSKDLEMLWRHEQAHIARRDDWTQLFSECLFALVWFHPAAHWVRRQLEKERELACDETVVNSGVEASRYAGALGRWAERAATNELPVGVMGLGRSRALIIRRIGMLLSNSRIARRSGGRWAFAGSLAAALGASLLLVVSGPAVIRAQTVAEPVVVDVEIKVHPVVDAAVPVVAVAPHIHVEPVLVSQVAPAAPQAPPVPSAAPAPAGVPAPPVPPVPPVASAREHHEWAQRWREQMQPQLEAIQREASRIQDVVRAKMVPQQEKLGELAKAIAEEHAKSIQPLARQMAELGSRMAQAGEAQREELAAKMEALSKQMTEREPEFRRLAEEISTIEIDMRPFEEEMKELERGLLEKQKAFKEADRKFRESVQPIP